MFVRRKCHFRVSSRLLSMTVHEWSVITDHWSTNWNGLIRFCCCKQQMEIKSSRFGLVSVVDWWVIGSIGAVKWMIDNCCPSVNWGSDTKVSKRDHPWKITQTLQRRDWSLYSGPVKAWMMAALSTYFLRTKHTKIDGPNQNPKRTCCDQRLTGLPARMRSMIFFRSPNVCLKA